ncbi:MAG: XdhC family protein [Akkermansiaceae bacterium]|nr:XdhC family protein [Akkermansiaceae bacterium]
MDIWEVIESQRRQGEPIVVATVAAGRGSVPGETGAKAVVSGAGLIAGTLGGGKIEARALAEAATVLAGGPACVMRTWNLQRDIGMTCGGEMTLLFERISPGQVATLRCRIDVVDERPEWLARLPEAENIARHRVAAFEDGVSLVGGGSFVLTISKGHATDRPVLRDVLRRHPEIPYLGVIGSAAKRAVLRRELAEDAIREDLLDKIICPLGLAVGGNDPAEIAVSIAAQLLQRRDVLISEATGRSPV